MADETWRFNHNPEDDGPSINYWKGKIRADGQSYDAYYGDNIPLVAVDETAEKKINFQFRPSVPNANHADTGNRIKSMPADLPKGLRVQVQSANVHPDHYLPILEGLFRKLGVHTKYLEAVHSNSRLTALAIYVRLDRDISERRIVDRDGLLERLARFSSVRRGQGEWKWNNEEIIGHRTAVALDPMALEKFYPGHRVGKLIKSYHMKNPSKDQGAVTYHPKFEIQWNKEYSTQDSAYWHASAHDPDRQEVLAELETMLYHALQWADLPLTPDPDVYVEDAYFSLEERDRDLELIADPTDHLADYERDVATTAIITADLTSKQKAALRSLTDGGSGQSIADVATTAGISEITVRRTIDKLSDIFRISNGRVSPEDEIIATKLKDIFHSIDYVLYRAKDSIRLLASRGELVDENSALGKWARRNAVTVNDADPDALEIAINLGELTEYQLVKIVRAGYTAAKMVGSRAAQQFTNARIRYMTADGGYRTAWITHYGHDPRILGYPLR